MREDLRHARRVRLAASHPELVRRGALLLEDALRTASLPEAGPGRVLLFRRLEVGAIAANAPPSRLALAIEQQVRRLAPLAVHAEEGSAPARELVFFRDDAEPPALLARRLARGEPVGAWYWPLAVPGFSPLLPREEALRLTLRAALGTSAGPGALVRLVEELLTAGALEPLLGALRWQEGPELLRAWQGLAPESSAAPYAEPAPPLEEGERPLVHPALRAVVESWVTVWSPRDLRSVWLCAVALCVERRERLADPHLLARAGRLAAALGASASARRRREFQQVQRAEHHTPRAEAPAAELLSGGLLPPEALRAASALAHVPAPEPIATPAPAPRESSAVSLTHASQPATSQAEPRHAQEPALPKSARPDSTRSTAQSTTRGTLAPRLAPWPELPCPTAVGGLLFLLPLLEQLGVATLLERYPHLLELALVDRLLVHVARRLGAPEEDPALAVFGAGIPSPPALSQGEREHAQPSEYSGGLLSQGEEHMALLLRALTLALGRLCRRQVRMGLRALVCRPARLVATRTHVDVLFSLERVDLRVRRAGLDLDPGWVPWLGRVVRFHYLHGEP